MGISIVFMFSGQGSHYFQMGRELFEKHPLFRKEMQHLDRIHQNVTGSSILSVLYNDQNRKSDVFDNLKVTHPAIFMVQHALTQVMLADNIMPTHVLGASLGEFAAAVSCGVLTAETALSAVIQQAQILEKLCVPGRMIAVLHDPALYSDPTITENSELAGVNFPSHFVLAGITEKLDIIIDYLKRQEIVNLDLSVKRAFHSSYIDPAATEYLRFISLQPIQEATIPFISCASANQINRVPNSQFWDCVRKPILFQQTIENLEKQGPHIYLDLGPSGTLATFVKQIVKSSSSSSAHALMTPYGQDLMKILKNLGMGS